MSGSRCTMKIGSASVTVAYNTRRVPEYPLPKKGNGDPWGICLAVSEKGDGTRLRPFLGPTHRSVWHIVFIKGRFTAIERPQNAFAYVDPDLLEHTVATLTTSYPVCVKVMCGRYPDSDKGIFPLLSTHYKKWMNRGHFYCLSSPKNGASLSVNNPGKMFSGHAIKLSSAPRIIPLGRKIQLSPELETSVGGLIWCKEEVLQNPKLQLPYPVECYLVLNLMANSCNSRQMSMALDLMSSIDIESFICPANQDIYATWKSNIEKTCRDGALIAFLEDVVAFWKGAYSDSLKTVIEMCPQAYMQLIDYIGSYADGEAFGLGNIIEMFKKYHTDVYTTATMLLLRKEVSGNVWKIVNETMVILCRRAINNINEAYKKYEESMKFIAEFANFTNTHSAASSAAIPSPWGDDELMQTIRTKTAADEFRQQRFQVPNW